MSTYFKPDPSDRRIQSYRPDNEVHCASIVIIIIIVDVLRDYGYHWGADHRYVIVHMTRLAPDAIFASENVRKRLNWGLLSLVRMGLPILGCTTAMLHAWSQNFPMTVSNVYQSPLDGLDSSFHAKLLWQAEHENYRSAPRCLHVAAILFTTGSADCKTSCHVMPMLSTFRARPLLCSVSI